jgi:hypothetical protein
MVQAAVTDLDTYVSGTTKTLTNKTLTAPKFVDGGFIADGNGNESVVFQTTASAVNQLDITNGATGGAVILSATGDDTNVDMTLTPQGTGEVNIAAGNLNYAGTAVTSTGTELNLLAGVSGLVQADLTKLAAVDATAAELNIMDAGTSATGTTVADADRVVLNDDDGSMVQVAMTDINTYVTATSPSGGVFTQNSSKSTGVTLSKYVGQITLHNASLANEANVTFTVTNTLVAATDVVVAVHGSAGTAGGYLVQANTMGSGNFKITVRNISGGALAEAIVVNFSVIKGASS